MKPDHFSSIHTLRNLLLINSDVLYFKAQNKLLLLSKQFPYVGKKNTVNISIL